MERGFWEPQNLPNTAPVYANTLVISTISLPNFIEIDTREGCLYTHLSSI